MADNLRDLALIIKSRFPLVLVETGEEVRMMQLLERVANLEGWPLLEDGEKSYAGTSRSLVISDGAPRRLGGPQ